MRRHRGVTLVELVLVITMIALLAGIAAPRLSNALRRYRLDLTARRVMADMQLARTQAIRDKASRTIIFDVANSSYTLDGLSGDRVASGAYTVKLKPGLENRVWLYSANFNNLSQLTFNKFGVPAQSGTVVLADGQERAILTVSGTTGRVRCTRQAH